MPVQVNGQDRLRARRDGLFDRFWIEIERGIVHVHVNRFGVDVRDGPACGYEGARGGDDFVTLANAQQEHGDVQGGRAAIEGDAMFGSAKAGEILFELDDVGPEAKGAIIQGPGNGGIDFLAERAHLRGKIEVGDSLNFRS